MNAKTKIKCVHNACGNLFLSRPNDFLRGVGCPQCYGTPRKTTDIFKKEVQELVGDEYEVRSEYIRGKDKVRMYHKVCQGEYEVIPNSFLSGVRCSICDKYKKKTPEMFVAEVKELVGDEYTVITDYTISKEPVRIRHNIENCGKEYDVLPSKFLYGNRCPHCVAERLRVMKVITPEEYRQEVHNLVGDEYTVLEDYYNSITPLKMLHKICGKTYYQTPLKFRIGRRCHICRGSKGEREVSKYLDEQRIKYIREYREDGYFFDFYIPTHNLVIEYDGEQHFEAVNYFGGYEALKETQKRDRIKDRLAEKKGLKMVRIPYWEFENIEKIINELFG